MAAIRVYFEGGGSSRTIQRRLRDGMRQFLIHLAGPELRCPLVAVPCGPRSAAYAQLRQAAQEFPDDVLLLLVDAERPVAKPPAVHLAEHDKWPGIEALGDRCHLMVQATETWLVADPEALRAYYGHGFRPGILPRHDNLEQVAKSHVEEGLGRAVADSPKRRYVKPVHTGDLLALVDPEKVIKRCPHAARLRDALLALNP